jgi:hypothetical protein
MSRHGLRRLEIRKFPTGKGRESKAENHIVDPTVLSDLRVRGRSSEPRARTSGSSNVAIPLTDSHGSLIAGRAGSGPTPANML